MATLGLSTGSLKRVRSLTQQWEATHGRKATPEVIQALMEAELSTATKGANEAVRIEQDQERIDFTKSQADEKSKLDRERMEQSAKANQVSGAIQTGLLLKETGALKGIGKGLSAGKEAIFGAGDAASAGTAATSAGTAAPSAIPTVAGEAVTAPAAATTGTTAAGGETAGGGVGGTAFGIAALVLADAKIARDAHGEFGSLKERNRLNVQGLEFGGVSPGAAALFQKHGILSPDQLIEKYTGVDPSAGLDVVSDFVSDLIEDILPGGSDFFSSLGL